MLWPEKIETKDILNGPCYVNAFCVIFRVQLVYGFMAFPSAISEAKEALGSSGPLSVIPREEKKLLLVLKSKAGGNVGAETSFMKWQLL